jgi:hypothetical protein
MNSKGRNHVCSIKPLGTPIPNRINNIINHRRGLSSPDGIGCHNHPTEKYCHFEDVASNETKRLKERSNESFTEMDEH